MKEIRKKTWKKYFEEVLTGKKKFDLRLADFEVENGDVLILEEWDEVGETYTGREIRAKVSYVLKTKDWRVWTQEQINQYGFQVMQLEIIEKTETANFEARPGQIDCTNIRYAPVINCIIKCGDKYLLVKRNENMKLYPGFWNGVSGFLDDNRSIEEKVQDEIKEELQIKVADIISIKRGQPFNQESDEYQKTWIVHPVLVEVKDDVSVKLDWEATKFG